MTMQYEKIVSKLSQLSIYVMSFGISRPVEVLKLTVAHKLAYYSKFKSIPGIPQEPIIDSCIAAVQVMERLTSKSLPPQH